MSVIIAPAANDRSFADRAIRGEVTGIDLASLTYEEKRDYLRWLPLTLLRTWPLEDLTSDRQYDVLKTVAVRPEGKYQIRAVVFHQIYPSVKVTVEWKDAFTFLRSNAGHVEVSGVIFEGSDVASFAKWVRLGQHPAHGDRAGLYSLVTLSGTTVLEEVAR